MSRESLLPPIWSYTPRLRTEELQRWCNELAVPPLVAQVLYNRTASLAEAHAFLDDSFDGTIGEDPYLFAEMPQAVERIKQALAQHEKITIYGDYDVDGICGTTLLVQALRAYGAQVDAYIPHRSREGYGLSTGAIDTIQARGTSLIITVDCGVMGHTEVEHARRLGIDVIVTDHHRAPLDDVYPQAVAVLHSKRGSYPNHDLTGSGVAWKLAVALERVLGTQINTLQLLDLVALGAVCDVTPIRGENRMLVRQGLRIMQGNSCRCGVQALLKAARVEAVGLSTQTLGFALGPRLNAAGRMEDALIAYNLMSCVDADEAYTIAEQLELLNRERQALVRKLEEEIEAELSITPDTIPPLIWIDRPDIPLGVAGLLAGNLSNRYYRPAVALERGEVHTRGSARSIPEVNIMEALKRCSSLLERYGGHDCAAGLGVATERLPLLRAHLSEACALQLRGEVHPRLTIDAKVRLSSLTWEIYNALQRLQPFGQSNLEPVFASQYVRVMYADSMSNGKHMRLRLNDGNGITISAVGWNMGALLQQVQRGSVIDIAYTLEENRYNGNTELRLKIKAIRCLE